MDGAASWRLFRHITWPLLGPTTFLLLILNVIYSLHVFDLIYVMTGGGPGSSTTVLVQYIYEAAFQNSEMGYASAVGVVLYLMLLVFTVFQWRYTRQGEGTEEDVPWLNCSPWPMEGRGPLERDEGQRLRRLGACWWRGAIVMVFPLYWMFVDRRSPEVGALRRRFRPSALQARLEQLRRGLG